MRRSPGLGSPEKGIGEDSIRGEYTAMMLSQHRCVNQNRIPGQIREQFCDRKFFLQFAESGQFLSRRDLPGSADHRHRFAGRIIPIIHAMGEDVKKNP